MSCSGPSPNNTIPSNVDKSQGPNKLGDGDTRADFSMPTDGCCVDVTVTVNDKEDGTNATPSHNPTVADQGENELVPE